MRIGRRVPRGFVDASGELCAMRAWGIWMRAVVLGYCFFDMV